MHVSEQIIIWRDQTLNDQWPSFSSVYLETQGDKLLLADVLGKSISRDIMLKFPMNSSFLSRPERSKQDEYFGILWMLNILSYSVSVTWRIRKETSETIQVPGGNDMIKLDCNSSVFRIASRELHTVTKPDNRLSSYFKRQISIILCNHIW
jgi:hypothetical protein